LNDGGESFPSEVLSVGLKSENAPVVLVVNGFDRISGPAFFDNGKTTGVAWWNDQGVPYISDIGHVGNQYDFDRKSDWKDDDSPGWGASHGDMEGKVIPGNSFDFTRVHGDAILSAGYSFVSVSDEVFTQPQFNTSLFPMIDIILGEEKSTPSLLDKHKAEFQIYTPAFMSKVKGVTDQGKGIFMSGAYVGSDLLKTSDSTAIRFARDILHFEWRTDHAVADGDFYSTDAASKSFKGKYTFNTSYNPKLYTVEAPDAIEPEGNNALTIFRYRENNSSAAVSFSGKYRTVVFGFPFETIKSDQERKDLMLQVLNFLNSK
ncbi:MAG TPA: xanthan lyase, partial [Bacteroidales bacterium]|nr:xanthan lyase [Bacteroidales bacterium]